MSDYDLFLEIHSSAMSFYCVFTNAPIDVTKECHAAYLKIRLLFRVIYKIFMVFELFETIISK